MAQTQTSQTGGLRPPPTSERVSLHTSEKATERIRSETLRRLRDIGYHPSRIERRLCALSVEWDIERVLEVNAALATLASVYLGYRSNPRWYLLSGVVGGFLLQHAIQGWCPPASIFRRLGFRTEKEIQMERVILKARRGDIHSLEGNADDALASLEY